MRRTVQRFSAVLLLLSCPLVGCTGAIIPRDGEGEDGGDGAGGERPSGQGGSSPMGTGGRGGGSTIEPPPIEACRDAAPVIPKARVWRLSAAQYAAAVEQTFGAKVDVSSFPLDGVSDDAVTRYDTSASANLVTDRLAQGYADQAVSAAATIVAGLQKQGACVLGAAPDASCVSSFWNDAASKAYRRPLTPEERTRFVAFFDKARAAWGSATATQLGFEAILQSPHFLYRSELGATSVGDRVPLTQHELAAQLSFFLADAPPDAALRAAADQGALKSPADLRPHAERLLASPTARAKLRTFFASYLGVKALAEGKSKDARLFPEFTDALKGQLLADALAGVERAASDGEGTLEAVLTEKTALGASLRALYGSEDRPGLVTHPGVIAAMSNEGSTSPVHRGLFVTQTMLCQALPVPPPNASAMVEALTDPQNPDGTQREQWAYFERTQAGCAACHRIFHPIGLGFEQYDPIGRYRATERGRTIDPKVVIKGLGEDVDGTYEDGVTAVRRIAGTASGRSCFALHVATFGFGREIDAEAEACQLAKHGASSPGTKPLDLGELLISMTQDDSFTHRSYR